MTYFQRFLRRVFCSFQTRTARIPTLAISLAFSQKCLYCPHIYSMCGSNFWFIYYPVMQCHYFPSLTKNIFLEYTEGINPAVKLNQVILTLFEGHCHGRHLLSVRLLFSLQIWRIAVFWVSVLMRRCWGKISEYYSLIDPPPHSPFVHLEWLFKSGC